jgi:cytochrome b561
MLVLIAATYAAIELRTFFPKGTALRDGFKTYHFILGLTVLLLVIIRIIARLATTAPPISPPPPIWQKRAGKAVHIALYVLMLGMPIGGWLILSGSGAPIPFYGLNLPALIGPNKALAGQIKEIHETVGTIGYWLIGLHAAAALFHHYRLKDDTLRRMSIRR